MVVCSFATFENIPSKILQFCLPQDLYYAVSFPVASKDCVITNCIQTCLIGGATSLQKQS